MKAVHFGAGNIGRGFVGLLLAQSGYDVCFVTRDQEKVHLLQDRKQYPVTLANEISSTVTVRNVTALNISQTHAVAEVVATADLVTTAVGSDNLQAIAPVLAKGIERRLTMNPQPLNIMACENALGSGDLLKHYVLAFLRPECQEEATQLVAFPNVVVDRIIPAQTSTDPLAVKTEPYFEWMVSQPEILGTRPPIEGVQYVDSLEPFIERKLFTLNTGHCSAAYYGYAEGYQTIQQVLGNPLLRERVRLVLQETGNLLVRKHGFDPNEHKRYIRKILQRFSNPHLVDKIVRVGRNPIRKLSANERLLRPALESHQLHLNNSHLTAVIAAGLLFDHAQDPQAVILQATISETGVAEALTKFTGIPKRHPLHEKILSSYRQFTSTVSHLAVSL